MKSIFKNLIIRILLILGAQHFIRSLNQNKILIIMYHGITENDFSFPCWWQLPKKKFSWQIEYLHKHYNILPLSDVISRIKEDKQLPSNVAVITFDDGFENNFTNAFPILHKLNLPATIFLTTDLIGTQQKIWIDDLWLHFSNTKKSNIDLREFNLGIMSLSDKHKDQTFNKVSSWLKRQDFLQKNKALEYLKKSLDCNEIESEYSQDFHLLSWVQIENMKETGLISFGAHTCTHEIVSRLDQQTLEYEILNSCKTIKPYTKDILFAYPNGKSDDYDDRSKKALIKANVVCALTTNPGLNSRKNDLFELKRISIGNDMTNELFESLCSGLIK